MPTTHGMENWINMDDTNNIRKFIIRDIISYNTKHGKVYVFGKGTDKYANYIDNLSDLKSKCEYCDNHDLYVCYENSSTIQGIIEKIRVFFLTKDYKSRRTFNNLLDYYCKINNYEKIKFLNKYYFKEIE